MEGVPVSVEALRARDLCARVRGSKDMGGLRENSFVDTFVIMMVTLILSSTAPVVSRQSEGNAGTEGDGDEKTRVSVGVLFRADLPGLLTPAAFLHPGSTPTMALAIFPPRVVDTIQRWWLDPMHADVTAEDAQLTNDAISAYVRSNNAAIYQLAIESLRVELAVHDPAAQVAPLYTQIGSPLGYVSLMNVDPKTIHRIRQIPLIAETKALVTPVELFLANAYPASRAQALATSRGATGNGITMPATFAVAIPPKLSDGQDHRLNAMLVTHAEDSGIDGLNVRLEFSCVRADGAREGGSGTVYGDNGAQIGFLLRPDHADCQLKASQRDGSASTAPFVIVVNSEIGWS